MSQQNIYDGSKIKVKSAKTSSPGRTSGDADGYKRGATGYAANKGKNQNMWDSDCGPLAVSFDRAKQQGPKSGGGEVGDFTSGKLRDSYKGSVGID